MLADRYRLVRSLGQGGMGEVWEAHDGMLRRPVAVKLVSVLAGGGSRADEARARFLREARITAALQHPNIVTVHDLGQAATSEGTTPFLVMELLRGEGLDAILRRGPVSLAHAAEWGRQICAALAHAHAAGVLHRDIKPGNLLVTASGTVKVLDFGIARAADPAASGDVVTQTGLMVGTPPYMAPEQARGRPEARSDLYGLGCILFEMVTGRRPFLAPDTVGFITAHLTERPPAPSTVVPGIPAEWDQLILALLQKEPENRYGSAAELAAALERLARGPAVPVALGHTAGGPATPSVTAPTPYGPASAVSTAAPVVRNRRPVRPVHLGLLVLLVVALVLAGRWVQTSLGSGTPAAGQSPGGPSQDSQDDDSQDRLKDSEDDAEPSAAPSPTPEDGTGGEGRGETGPTPDEDVQAPPVESEPAPPPVEQQPDPPAEEEPDPRPTQAEPTQPEPDPEPPAPADPGAPGREHCHYSDDRSKEVSEGMSGEEVREIQCLLVYNYGKDLDLDGIFGPLTENAVKEVQACSGLEADGIVGPMTWPVLDSPKPECAA